MHKTLKAYINFQSALKSARLSTTNESGIYYSKPIDQQEKGASPSSYLSPVRCLDNSQEPKTNDHDQKPVPKKDKNQTVVNRSNQKNYYALGSVIPTGRKSNLGNGINLQPKDSQQNECSLLYPTLPLLCP